MVSHVALRGITKSFHGVRALHGIDLDVERGTIHALVGENGAGKSTVGKIIAGVYRPDAGVLMVDGESVEFHSPAEALSRGITTIAQEISLVPDRTVVENVFLGIESQRCGVVATRHLAQRYKSLIDDVGFHLPAQAVVRSLRIADQQKVEVLRAVARDARLIVMDEPTAALTVEETQKLIAITRRLRERGTTIVYVSHFLPEVLALADRVTVLRDGAVIKTTATAGETPSSLVEAMLGRPMEATFPVKTSPESGARVLLRVDGLTTPAVRDVSFDVRAGEIVGLAGLVGSGRTEVARAIFGADPRIDGSFLVDGREVVVRSPRAAIRAGIAMLPESRKAQGLLLERSVAENITLSCMSRVARAHVLLPRKEAAATRELVENLSIRGAGRGLPVKLLSGGNQQKVLFAKWLFPSPKVLIVDEPTRGIDVGAKRAIYALLADLAKNGLAVLMISSELEEVVGLCHRVIVMRGGEVQCRLEGEAIREDAVMAAAFGTDPGVAYAESGA